MHEADGAAEARTNFAAAAAWAVEVVDAVPASGWDAPGLGDWDLRALVGHTSRALLTVEQYLARPAHAEAARSADEYFARSLQLPGASDTAVLQRGIEAGAALGDDPALAFAEIAGRVLGVVKDAGNPLIETIVGGMRLAAYLPTRAFELVVHGLDVRAAVIALDGHAASAPPPEPPASVLGEALELAGAIAARRGVGSALLLAATGRGPLPERYSVLGQLGAVRDPAS
ncbi:maleylpyruvate isomerase N-terminal domain-containing protein [Leucobacter sp. USHLN153]|uniref:maleylpyruvate isomerase N-terminal domain-containing protein n=1 Tax=Leucobacter sp. USHLN153 TaxID=3081268 RepID=UPI00301A381D